MANLHAAARILLRLPEPERLPTARALGTFAAQHPESTYAVQVNRHRTQRANTWSASGSAGELVVAIIRQGRIATVMLRHAWQPFTREEFDVEHLAALDMREWAS